MFWKLYATWKLKFSVGSSRNRSSSADWYSKTIIVITKNIFSSTVFQEKGRYCSSLGVVAVVFVIVQNLTFCNISVITEDIYLKLWVCVHYPKSSPYYQGRQFKMLFFFRIMTLFPLRLFILYQAPHSRELAHACSALVSLILQDFLKLKLRQALIGQTR